MQAKIPFFSSKAFLTPNKEKEEQTSCMADFLLAELILLKEKKETEFSSGFLSIAETLLLLTDFSTSILKKIVFHGTTFGLSKRSSAVLSDTLAYADILFKKLDISSSDRISLLSAKAAICFELFNITQNYTFLSLVSDVFIVFNELLRNNSHLENKLGWSHLEQDNKRAEISELASARVYHTFGKAFFLIFSSSHEIHDLFVSQKCFMKALKFRPHHPRLLADYADTLSMLGMKTGKSAYIENALHFLSRAIFLSFNRDAHNQEYQDYRCRYAYTAINLYNVTCRPDHLNQASRILYECVQAFPNLSSLWSAWGGLLIFAGWLNGEPKYLEAGLDKLSFAQKGDSDPLQIATYLSSGIAYLGLHLEEPSLFREGYYKLVEIMKSCPGYLPLVGALGSVQLCSALYFKDAGLFSFAISCFQSYLQFDGNNVDNLHKLFMAYFYWGESRLSLRLFYKALNIVKTLCDLRPEIALFWKYRGTTLRRLAEITSDPVYKELYLEESIWYYRRAWELDQKLVILELWAESYCLLGRIQHNLACYEQCYELFTLVEEELLSSKAKLLIGISLLGKGIILEDGNLVQRAIFIFDDLLGESKEDSNLMMLLGDAWLFLFSKTRFFKCYQKSRRYLYQAVALGCTEAYYSLSKLYTANGNVDQANAMLLRAESFGSTFASASFAIGKFYVPKF
ncbi:tetratricopeptide repeat family protein [Chlamydia ibidis]|uniref:Tetratricopeptide repeat family protein n=2 Tax=Chlamydia ibidis TaxID=1405396 RepID=S7J2F6_9CHLA|nr:tetratricopeptide repeat family protein [Chlamydia ibidis]EPP34413.1 tetratricopeptide repeat family protein [Chlamydia ibidis]EQM62529.1 hypothetical protein H359_0560 [Chlamydia ibidis 10-1398/6]